MVVSLKGSLKQTFNTMGAGSDEELQADVRSSFGIWTVDPGQVIANEITREQKEEELASARTTKIITAGYPVSLIANPATKAIPAKISMARRSMPTAVTPKDNPDLSTS